MTLSEAFVFKTGNQISASDADMHLGFVGLNPTDTFDPNNLDQKCKFYEALLAYLSQDGIGVKSITEGGYSIVYDIDLKGKALENLALESGCNQLIDKYSFYPRVQNKSYMW